MKMELSPDSSKLPCSANSWDLVAIFIKVVAPNFFVTCAPKEFDLQELFIKESFSNWMIFFLNYFLIYAYNQIEQWFLCLTYGDTY